MAQAQREEEFQIGNRVWDKLSEANVTVIAIHPDLDDVGGRPFYEVDARETIHGNWRNPNELGTAKE